MAQGDFHFYRIALRTAYNDTAIPTPSSRQPSYYVSVRIEESAAAGSTDTEAKRLAACIELANQLVAYLQSQGNEATNIGCTRIGIEKFFNPNTTPDSSTVFSNLSSWYVGTLPSGELVGKPFPKRAVSYTNNLGNIVLTLDTIEPTDNSPDILAGENNCIEVLEEINGISISPLMKLVAHDYKGRETGIVEVAQQNIYTATR